MRTANLIHSTDLVEMINTISLIEMINTISLIEMINTDLIGIADINKPEYGIP